MQLPVLLILCVKFECDVYLGSICDTYGIKNLIWNHKHLHKANGVLRGQTKQVTMFPSGVRKLLVCLSDRI